MGRFLKKFKNVKQKGKDVALNTAEKMNDTSTNGPKQKFNKRKFRKRPEEQVDVSGGFEEDYEENLDDDFDRFDRYDDVGVQPAQKPESFHHFILENQYKDLERSIRGLKDVWNKDTQTWTTKRKDLHCFTDEEAEDILRTAQSHLATDVKLGWIKAEIFGDYMNALYKEIAFLFESIAEYRYGRFGSYEKQYQMKLQNQKIFLELWTRVQANYSRSVNGQENKFTHESVKGQESLQSTDREDYRERGYT